MGDRDLWVYRNNVTGAWRLFFGGHTLTSEPDSVVESIIPKIKPVLDILEPKHVLGASDPWRMWIITKEELESILQGGGNG